MSIVGRSGSEKEFEMDTSQPVRILVVSDEATVTPELVSAIRQRAQRGPAQFRMLVPNPAPAEWHPLHPERHSQAAAAEQTLAQALPRIEEAAGGPVIGSISIRHDPMDAIEQTIHDEPVDEIILSGHRHPTAARLHVDLPHRLAHLGLPVTSVSDESPAAESLVGDEVSTGQPIAN